MKERIQYVGLSVVAGARQYRFLVSAEAEADRTFVMEIASADFRGGRLRFQDGPEVSLRKLRLLLAADPAVPLDLQQRLTNADVEAYAASGKPVPKPSGHWSGLASSPPDRNRPRQ